MSYKIIIPAVFGLLMAFDLSGQSVQFTYDDNGNRISRSVLTAEELEPDGVSFPVDNPGALTPRSGKKGKGSDGTEKTSSGETSESIGTAEPMYIEDDPELEVRIYPNPTKGFLRIEFSGMPAGSKNEMRLYDLRGTELMITRDFEGSYEMNISHLTDGIYILRIMTGSRLLDFRIIKRY